MALTLWSWPCLNDRKKQRNPMSENAIDNSLVFMLIHLKMQSAQVKP